MTRATLAVSLTLALASTSVLAQDAATRKATRAIHAQEKEVLNRVTLRLEYDKKLDGSTLKVEVQPGGAVTLSGSVKDEAARRWAVVLVENTTGVVSVLDRLAVVQDVRVYEAPAASTATATATTPVVEVARPVVVPAQSKIIVKP